MQIELDLSQFKSAGVYTIEIDNSQRITVTTQSLRLVPGFSAQGPFNIPVFITDTGNLSRFYGPIDLKLEKKGSFFHRSIQTCLLAAPVFAINLLAANNNPSNGDKVECTALSLDTNTNTEPIVYSDLYVNFFNRQRFWTPDPIYLQGVISNKTSGGDELNSPLFQFANVGTKKVSFIVRKAQGLSQYGVFAKDWYGSAQNIPYAWIRPYDHISDYFIQVIAIEGDWTNYTTLSSDPYYNQFFISTGIIPSQLQNFMNSPNINVIGSWIGTIIPDFIDQTGAEQYIQTIVNGSTPLTGVLLGINHQALDQLVWNSTLGEWVIGDDDSQSAAPYQIDLVGHNLINQTGVISNFLSYDISVLDPVIHTQVSLSPYNGDTTGMIFWLDSSSNNLNITVGSLIQKMTDGTTPPGVTYVTEKYYDTSGYVIETAEPLVGSPVSHTSYIIQKPIDDPSIATSYQFIEVDGLAIKNRHLPGYDTKGSPEAEAGVEKIYGMLEDPGILRGLTNPDMIQYRYIVDTMAYGLQPELGGKAHLSRLAKARGSTTAIISAPAIAQFAASTDPYFCDIFVPGVDPTPIFDSAYIAQGGNPEMPRTGRFSLPTEVDGAKYCGVFGPFLQYNDGAKIINVPPAADVANTYVAKFLGGNPFAIVANRNGILSNPAIVGVEYPIDKQDRDNLEPFGYNSIISKPSTGQVLIYANSTAYQVVKSDFNNLHVRELLNTLELQINEILEPYVYDWNNPITRLNIVTAVTPILQTVKDAGALINYTIEMDATNNPATIPSDFGFIDIGVWITGALRIIINRITVNSNSSLSSGGFVF